MVVPSHYWLVAACRAFQSKVGMGPRRDRRRDSPCISHLVVARFRTSSADLLEFLALALSHRACRRRFVGSLAGESSTIGQKRAPPWRPRRRAPPRSDGLSVSACGLSP